MAAVCKVISILACWSCLLGTALTVVGAGKNLKSLALLGSIKN